MAAPTFVAASAEVESSSATPTVSLPAGWAADDILVLLYVGGSGAVTGAGWQKVASHGSHQVLWKRATSGETNPTFATAGGLATMRLTAWRGAAALGNPWGQQWSHTNVNSGTQYNYSDGTNSPDNRIIYIASRTGTNSTGGTGNWTAPSTTGFAIHYTDQLSTTGLAQMMSGTVAAEGGGGNASTTGLTNSTGFAVTSLHLLPAGEESRARMVATFPRNISVSKFVNALGTNGGTITPTMPRGYNPDVGDLLVAMIHGHAANATPSITLPSGWAFASATPARHSGGVFAWIAYKILDLDEWQAPVFTAPNGATDFANGWGSSVTAFRGVDPNTPINVAAAADTATGTSDLRPANVTPTENGALIVSVGVQVGSRFINTDDAQGFIRHSSQPTAWVDTQTSTGSDWSIGGLWKYIDPAAATTIGRFKAWVDQGNTNPGTGNWAASTVAFNPLLPVELQASLVGEANMDLAMEALFVGIDIGMSLVGEANMEVGDVRQFRAAYIPRRHLVWVHDHAGNRRLALD